MSVWRLVSINCFVFGFVFVCKQASPEHIAKRFVMLPGISLFRCFYQLCARFWRLVWPSCLPVKDTLDRDSVATFEPAFETDDPVGDNEEDQEDMSEEEEVVVVEQVLADLDVGEAFDADFSEATPADEAASMCVDGDPEPVPSKAETSSESDSGAAKKPVLEVEVPADKAEEPSQVKPTKRPAAVLKKPAARGPRPKELCAGYNGEPCQFSASGPGVRARVHPERDETHCLFCNREAMEKASRVKRSNRITCALKKFVAADEGIFEAALERVKLFLGEDAAEEFRKKATPRAPAQPREPRPPPTTWEEQLARRELAGKELDRKQRQVFEGGVRMDQRMARRKIFFPEKVLNHRAPPDVEASEKEEVAKAGPIGSLASNDSDLPVPADEVQRHIEEWCKEGSWALCAGCGSLRLRNMEPQDARGKRQQPTMSKKSCSACKDGTAYVPKPSDIPEKLRGLRERVWKALRPLVVDTGKYERSPNGYRAHTAMISFAWAPKSVRDQIKELPKESDQAAALAALRPLGSLRRMAEGCMETPSPLKK